MGISEINPEMLRRALIASANPLFSRGLQKLVAHHWNERGVEICLAASMDEATRLLETWQPDLVIVDYDDAGRPGSIQREVFLSHFINGDRPMQVMLVSLRASGEIVVYDRRTLTSAQAEDWLDQPWNAPGAAVYPPRSTPSSSSPSSAAPAGDEDVSI